MAATQSLIEGFKNRKEELMMLKRTGKLTNKQVVELEQLNRFIKRNEKHFYPKFSKRRKKR